MILQIRLIKVFERPVLIARFSAIAYLTYGMPKFGREIVQASRIWYCWLGDGIRIDSVKKTFCFNNTERFSFGRSWTTQFDLFHAAENGHYIKNGISIIIVVIGSNSRSDASVFLSSICSWKMG